PGRRGDIRIARGDQRRQSGPRPSEQSGRSTDCRSAAADRPRQTAARSAPNDQGQEARPAACGAGRRIMGVLRISPISGKNASFGTIIDSHARRQWMVLVSNRFDDEATILIYGWNNGFLPRPFLDRHPSAPLLLCRKCDPEQDRDHPLKWIV